MSNQTNVNAHPVKHLASGGPLFEKSGAKTFDYKN